MIKKIAVDFGLGRLQEQPIAEQFTGSDNLLSLVGNLIQIVIAFSGVIVFLYIVWSGWLWMTAAGDEKKVAKAKRIIIDASIGLAILMLSYAITSFIFEMLTKNISGG